MLQSKVTRQLSLVALASFAASTPTMLDTSNGTSNAAGYDTSRVGPSNANCTRQTYQLDITSDNVVFQNVDSNANQTYLAALMQTFITAPMNFTQQYQSPNKQQVSNTYSLSGTLCIPNNGVKNSSHVQYLVHGVGFDSSYWDFVVGDDESYSYVHAAAEAGYTTFRYDRLGTGLSEHPQDGYNVVQSPTDLAIATKFAEMLRSGAIGGQAFDKVVGVGHSYGSVQLQALTATAPQALDGVLLQGFSANGSAMGLFASGGAFTTATQAAPDRFSSSDLSNAYLITGYPHTNQFDFFYFPYFSDEAFQRDRETEQPVSQGVLFTQTTIMAKADNFTGPVHVVTADKDFPFCLRDCYAVPEKSTKPNIPAFAQELYPSARNFTTYIPANTGHAVNQHYSAPEVYQEMLIFVSSVLA